MATVITVTTRVMSLFRQNICKYLLTGHSSHRNNGRTWIFNPAAITIHNIIGLISLLMIVMVADVHGKRNMIKINMKILSSSISVLLFINQNGKQ